MRSSSKEYHSAGIDYRYDTGSPADGVTVTIPIAALGQVPAERFEWLVPGYLPERIEELVRSSLPKELRKTFIPIGDAARDAAAELTFGEGSLYEGLAAFSREARRGFAFRPMRSSSIISRLICG